MASSSRNRNKNRNRHPATVAVSLETGTGRGFGRSFFAIFLKTSHNLEILRLTDFENISRRLPSAGVS